MTTQNLGLLLLKTFQWFDERLLLEMAKNGYADITKSQSLIFAEIDAGNLRISDIARALGTSRQATHKMVSELTNQGYLTLEIDPNNASAKRIAVSQKGHICMEMAGKIYTDLEKEFEQKTGAMPCQHLRQTLTDFLA